MRGTGSNDVVIDGHVVPEAAVAVHAQGRRMASAVPHHRDDRLPADLRRLSRRRRKRPRHRDRGSQRSKQPDQHALSSPGGMETELARGATGARWMLAAVRLNAPSAETVNQVMIGRQLVARHAIAAVELAMELAGGAGFYRATGLERRFRDIQAARYHPLQAGPQARICRAMALGLPVDKVF